jgi:carboxypeptidase T
MRRLLVSMLLSALLPTLLLALDPAAAEAARPRLVRVEMQGDIAPETLIDAGLDVIEVHRGDHCLILEWPGDAARLARLGAATTVLDPDPGRTAALRSEADLAAMPRARGRRVRSAARADGIFRVETLPPYGSGSFAGYWSLEEIKMKLDQLVADDLDDVVAAKVDTIGWSLQGRPIWGLRLGKTVPPPDTRPVVFYNALTHAREPGGMQALLYFVDHLLSGYGADPIATYLLDHRVLYVAPVVNPDGYKVNHDHWLAHGSHSFHRKNARDTNGNGLVDNGTDGVDINRNYGHEWGLPGSSPNPLDATYRGTAPFSEPETSVQRDLVNLLQPKTGLSFHTWGDLLIHPWGYTAEAAPDSAKFYEWNDDMTLGNGYHGGQGPRILYVVSGEFTDWCYGEVGSKPRMFAWTPEVGGPADGFWPPASRLVALGEENLRSCYYTAAIAGPHVRVEDWSLTEGALNRGSIAHLRIRARNRGLGAVPGPALNVALSSLSAGAHVIQGTAAMPTLESFQSGDVAGAPLVIAADDTVTLGRMLRFGVDFISSDGTFSRDTLEMFCGTPTVLFADDADNLTNWSTTTWSVQSGDPARPGSFFSDSPNLYPINSNNRRITLLPALNLSTAVHAYAVFLARWEFETDYDYGLVEAKTTGAWSALPGRSTVLGGTGGGQPTGVPLYEGARRNWRPERVDLSSFAGPGATAVSFQFGVHSNGSENFDGWRVDSMRIVTFDPAAQPAPVAVGDGEALARLDLATPMPNPTRGRVRLAFAWPYGGRARLEVLDLQGRRIRTLLDGPLRASRYEMGWDLRDLEGRPVAPGLYLIRLSGERETVTRRLAVLPG